jgi:hypothetical protein
MPRAKKKIFLDAMMTKSKQNRLANDIEDEKNFLREKIPIFLV